MESTSSAMKVHISQTTKDHLGPNYKLTERGEVEVKGKGTMKTYWLEDREYRSKLMPHSNNLAIMPPPMQQSIMPAEMTMLERKQSAKERPRSVTHVSPTGKASSSTLTVTISSKSSTVEPDRRIYSPVTFQDVDVALRSIANSPVRAMFCARGKGAHC